MAHEGQWREPDELAEEIIGNIEAGLASFREILKGLAWPGLEPAAA